MSNPTEGNQISTSYEVLSPWADADPVPMRGLSPRPAELAGKTIGLFSNRKRAASLVLSAVEREILERNPTARTSWYASTMMNTPEMLTPGKDKFSAWVESVDAVVLAVAD